MKTINIILLSLLTLSVPTLAEDLSIDQQIDNIKNASVEDRVTLMNQLKLSISSMNTNDRSDAINSLRLNIKSGQNHSLQNSTMHQDIQMQQMNNSDIIRNMDSTNTNLYNTMQDNFDTQRDMPIDESMLPHNR